MKVAIVTTDGETVSQHFGRSPYYKIYIIEDNTVIDEGLRERGTGHFSQEHQNNNNNEHNGEKHGMSTEAESKHVSMAQEISDCDILVAGGMGYGAYKSFRDFGIQVYVTDILYIPDVIIALVKGDLKDLSETRTH